jgi:hypothetical protein
VKRENGVHRGDEGDEWGPDHGEEVYRDGVGEDREASDLLVDIEAVALDDVFYGTLVCKTPSPICDKTHAERRRRGERGRRRGSRSRLSAGSEHC